MLQLESTHGMLVWLGVRGGAHTRGAAEARRLATYQWTALPRGGSMLEKDFVRRLLKVEDLPTLPTVMTRILEVLEDEGSSAQDLTEILETDHAISARVLRLANSALYGLRHRADSIRRAVVVIGFDAVRMLALATSVFDTLSQQRQMALDPEEFWLHSLGAAKAAQTLAKKHGGVESVEGCFTAGLLHDMGKYILALTLKDQYRVIVEKAKSEKGLLCDAEHAMLGVTHTHVGAWVGQRWHFPQVIIDAIEHQRHPTEYEGPHRNEVLLVSLASDLSRAAGFGNAGDFANPVIGSEHLRARGVEPEMYDEAMEQIREYQADARQFLETLEEG